MATDDTSGSNDESAAATASADQAAPSAQPGPLELNLAIRSDLDNPEAFGHAVDAGGGGAVDQSSDAGLRELPYDPDRARDATRQIIALWLLGVQSEGILWRVEAGARCHRGPDDYIAGFRDWLLFWFQTGGTKCGR
jgi:hypothetical protein